jgi:hypothetical protein
LIEEEVSIDGLAKKYPPVDTQAPDEGTAGSKDVFEGGAPSSDARENIDRGVY